MINIKLNINENIMLVAVPLMVVCEFFLFFDGLYRNDVMKADNTMASIEPDIGKPNSLLNNSITLPINSPNIIEVI